MPNGKFVSYLKSKMIIFRGCFFHLVIVMNVDSKNPSLESVPLLMRFQRCS